MKIIIQKVHESIQKESPNADTMIVAHETNDDITVSVQGDGNKIGKALYTAMHDANNPELAAQIYLMIKNITFNIINTPSEMADDMVSMFSRVTNKGAGKSKCKIISLTKTEQA